MEITTKENYSYGKIIFEDNNLRIEENYDSFDFMNFINAGLSIYKFGTDLDDADFLIHLINNITFNNLEQEKFNCFIKDYDLNKTTNN